MTASTPRIAATTGRPSRLIRLTPLIDVIFILLIFFMLASTLDPRGQLLLGLAEAGGNSQHSPQPIRVVLLPDGARVDGRSIPLASLSEAVVQRLEKTPAVEVTLHTRDGVTLQRLIQTVSDLREAGVGELALLPLTTN